MGSVALSSAGIGGVKHSNISWVGGRPYEWPVFSSSPLGLLLFSLSLELSLSACLILLILQRCPHTKSFLSNLMPLVLSQESLKGALQINEERLRWQMTPGQPFICVGTTRKFLSLEQKQKSSGRSQYVYNLWLINVLLIQNLKNIKNSYLAS